MLVVAVGARHARPADLCHRPARFNHNPESFLRRKPAARRRRDQPTRCRERLAVPGDDLNGVIVETVTFLSVRKIFGRSPGPVHDQPVAELIDCLPL